MVFGVFKLCLHGQCNVPQDPSGPSRTLPNKKHGVDKNVLNRHSGVRAQEIWNAQNGPSPIPRPAVESVRHPPWKVFGTRRGKCSAPAVESVRHPPWKVFGGSKTLTFLIVFAILMKIPASQIAIFGEPGLQISGEPDCRKIPAILQKKGDVLGAAPWWTLASPPGLVGRAALVGFRCLFFSPVFLFGSVRHGPLGSWAFG